MSDRESFLAWQASEAARGATVEKRVTSRRVDRMAATARTDRQTVLTILDSLGIEVVAEHCLCNPAIRMYCAASDCQGGSLVPSWEPATWADVRRGDVVRMPGNEATAARVVELIDLPWHVNDRPPAGLSAQQQERYLKNVQFRPQEHAAEWMARPVTLAPLDGGPQHRIPNVNPAAAVEIRLTRVEMDAIELLGGWANRIGSA